MPRAARGDGRRPEAVGDLLRSTLAGRALKPRDYQDLPLWRQLTGAFVAGPVQHTGGPVIVPMTVLSPTYAEEIFTCLRQAGRFHHFVLHAEPAAFHERIEASCECPGDPERGEAVRAYRRCRAADYQEAAVSWLHAQGHVIDTTALTADQTLQAALAHLHTAT
ncbi:ATP/GTP-binding protein [Streptomyces sp. NPDC019224]|uniref:ATP/GTP-binding protein n=1 Tax=Streptomyces sp. NPDC019224 TaxID=3154484 RepID=UPI0033E30D3D